MEDAEVQVLYLRRRYEFKKPALCGFLNSLLVREKGLEPSHLAAHAPKACVSTISPLAHICRIVKELILNSYQLVAKAIKHACLSPLAVTSSDPETSFNQTSLMKKISLHQSTGLIHPESASWRSLFPNCHWQFSLFTTRAYFALKVPITDSYYTFFGARDKY